MEEPEGSPSTTVEATASRETVASAAVCSGSGAHDAHAFSAGCVLCHECGGAYGFTDFTFARGTSTAGGTMTRTSTTTTCTVACHDQDGTLDTSVSWNSTGPLACSSCHTDVAPDGLVYRSLHAVTVPGNPAAERAGCEGCHELSGHVSGTVRITDGAGGYVEVAPNDATQITGACKTCHDGAGTPIAGRTPPLLVGYDTAGAGDFHGARAGTGFGGTLRSPYSRGQAPLACTACHSAHASTNDFMAAATVNGMAIPAGVIDRAGVGAQWLCSSCHEGERHQQCAGCHGADPMPNGSPCFACHGHEGIVTFPTPWQGGTVFHQDPRWACAHCHGGHWMPDLEYLAPTISNLVIANVTGSSATITWATSEAATSYVEYGEGGTLDRVAGGPGFANSHSVTLTGLADATAYSYRVRTSDRFRNVTLSAVKTFMTANPNAPGQPSIVPEPDAIVCWNTAAVTLQWYPVTDPNGDPVQYRAVVDDSPAFDSLNYDSGWISGTSYSIVVPASVWGIQYHWRVMARDAANDLWSPWSSVDAFTAMDLSSDSWCME